MSGEPTAVERLDVVAVGAHPDDVEITCGGTLALLVRQGYRVGMIDLTNGEPTPRGSEEIRAREAEAARRTLGVHVRINLGLPNRVLMDEPAARFRLATLLRRYRPTVLIAMAGRTPAASPDHHQGHLLAEAARFYSQLTKWDHHFDAEERHWHGSFVIDITETFEQKLEAVRCYQSQFDEQRFARVRHFLTGYNIFTGGRCGFAYGEMFALPHPVGARDLHALVLGGKGSPAPVQLPGQDHMPQG